MSLRRPLILLLLALQLALPATAVTDRINPVPEGPVLATPEGSCQGSSQCGG